MQLRYQFRLYPTRGQQQALARTFGCARIVFNDALRARKDARAAGLPFPKSGDLSKQLITEAKKTPERTWLSNAPLLGVHFDDPRHGPAPGAAGPLELLPGLDEDLSGHVWW